MAKLPTQETTTVPTADGKSEYLRKPIGVGDALTPGVKAYVHLTLTPGNAMHYHQHEGDSEIYYIIKGAGIYQDNGTEYPVTVGDAVYCADGDSHGIRNEGEEDLEFVALIMNTL